jgi:hypothetical protein
MTKTGTHHRAVETDTFPTHQANEVRGLELERTDEETWVNTTPDIAITRNMSRYSRFSFVSDVIVFHSYAPTVAYLTVSGDS